MRTLSEGARLSARRRNNLLCRLWQKRPGGLAELSFDYHLRSPFLRPESTPRSRAFGRLLAAVEAIDPRLYTATDVEDQLRTVVAEHVHEEQALHDADVDALFRDRMIGCELPFIVLLSEEVVTQNVEAVLAPMFDPAVGRLVAEGYSEAVQLRTSVNRFAETRSAWLAILEATTRDEGLLELNTGTVYADVPCSYEIDIEWTGIRQPMSWPSGEPSYLIWTDSTTEWALYCPTSDECYAVGQPLIEEIERQAPHFLR